MDLGGVLSNIDGIMLRGVRHGIVRLSPHGRMAFVARSWGFRRTVVWLKTTEEYW